MGTANLVCLSTTWTVNTINAYKLVPSFSEGSSTYIQATVTPAIIPGCSAVVGDFSVTVLSILHADGSTTSIGTSAAIQHVAQKTTLEGTDNQTLAISKTSMLPTDALLLTVYMSLQSGLFTANVTAVSGQLGWGSIEAATITLPWYYFVYHTCWQISPGHWENSGHGRIYWGDAGHATGISNILYEESSGNTIFFGVNT